MRENEKRTLDKTLRTFPAIPSLHDTVPTILHPSLHHHHRSVEVEIEQNCSRAESKRMLRLSIFLNCSNDRRIKVQKPIRTKQVDPTSYTSQPLSSVLASSLIMRMTKAQTYPQTFSVKHLSNPLTSSLTHSRTLSHAPTSLPSPLISSSNTFSSQAILTNFFIPTSNSLNVNSKFPPM